MGLDMMTYVVREKPKKSVDFLDDDTTPEQRGDLLFTWRKHPNLHGWMEELYIEKGGQLETGGMGGFNSGQQVELTMADLDRLEREIRDASFYEPGKVTGFFFGESDITDRDGDREFIRLARAAITSGKYLYYSSWW